jgi:hypothetical protein
VFLGHFGLAMAAKHVAPRTSLGTTLFAGQFLDVLWPIFVLTGIESFEITPGVTKVNPLEFTSYPWSHSLAMAFAWAALFGAVYWAVRGRARDAAVVAALVASHWVLDWIVHRPDLPLFPGDVSRHGLGLWNSLAASLAIELVLFAGGIVLFLRASRARDRIGSIGFWFLVALLAAGYLAATFGPPPPSTDAVAASVFVFWPFFAFAWWIDRHREPTHI